MSLPTEDEINVYNSLDEVTARDHFLNKTLEQAEELFRENSAYYQEDLMWMGPRAFAFYLQAAIHYVKSDRSMGDAQMINCLYEIVLFRSQQQEFVLALDAVKEMVAYVIEHYAKFDVDGYIYGDLLGKYLQLRRQLEELRASPNDTINRGTNNKQ